LFAIFHKSLAKFRFCSIQISATSKCSIRALGPLTAYKHSTALLDSLHGIHILSPSPNNLKEVQAQPELVTSGLTAQSSFCNLNIVLYSKEKMIWFDFLLHVGKGGAASTKAFRTPRQSRENVSAKSYLPQVTCPQQLKVMSLCPDCTSCEPSHCQ